VPVCERNRLGRWLKPAGDVGILREVGVQELDGHIEVEVVVVASVDDAHERQCSEDNCRTNPDTEHYRGLVQNQRVKAFGKGPPKPNKEQRERRNRNDRQYRRKEPRMPLQCFHQRHHETDANEVEGEFYELEVVAYPDNSGT
jgi:hypothetical protein